MQKNQVHPYPFGNAEEILRNKTGPSDGKRRMFSSDQKAAESQRMWNQTPKNGPWAMHKNKTNPKALPIHRMRKFLPIPNIARDSAVCLGANIRADLACFYPGVTLALKRQCWVLILPLNIAQGISHGKKFQIVINLLGQKPDFSSVWSKFSYFLISRSGFLTSCWCLVHIDSWAGPEDLLKTHQILRRDLRSTRG